jgi:hypothetical protein
MLARLQRAALSVVLGQRAQGFPFLASTFV